MRIIGSKMTEILGKKGQFPDQGLWPLGGSSDLDEQAITANLSAIANLEYTTEDYTTTEGGGEYRFCSSPLNSGAGSKQFCVHANSEMSTLFAPGVVKEVASWNGLGLPISFQDLPDSWNYGNGSNPLIHPNSVRRPEDAVRDEFSILHYLTGMLKDNAVIDDFRKRALEKKCVRESCTNYQLNMMGIGKLPGTYLVYSPEAAEIFRSYLPQIHEQLNQQGIHMFIKEQDYNLARSTQLKGGMLYGLVLDEFRPDRDSFEKECTFCLTKVPEEKLNSRRAFQIGFKLDDPVETIEELQLRKTEQCPGGFSGCLDHTQYGYY